MTIAPVPKHEVVAHGERGIALVTVLWAAMLRSLLALGGGRTGGTGTSLAFNQIESACALAAAIDDHSLPDSPLGGQFVHVSQLWLVPSIAALEGGYLDEANHSDVNDWYFSTSGLSGVEGFFHSPTLGTDGGYYRELFRPGSKSGGRRSRIPSEAEWLVFDYRFPQPDEGDWVALHFDDELLWMLRGDAVAGRHFFRERVSVRHLVGQTGTLRFTLVGASDESAEVLLGNFEIQAIVGVDIPTEADSFIRQTAPNSTEGANPRLELGGCGRRRTVGCWSGSTRR